MSGKLGPFPLHVASRDLTLAVVQLTTVNGADPTLVDPGGVVDTATRTGEGVIKVTLKDMFNYVSPQVSMVNSDDANHVTLTDMVDGQAADNYVEITTGSSSGTADDLPGAVVTLFLLLGN